MSTTVALGIWGNLPLISVAALFLVALVAGIVDAIAGGGGLLCLPALLWAGLPPSQALATGKLQSSFGAVSASVNFYRRGALDLRPMRWAVLLVFIGAVLGTVTVQVIDPSFLRSVLPILLLVIAAYFLSVPNIGEEDRHHRLSLALFALTVAPIIGFYDGFFGPGAGSFYAVAMVELLGYNLTRATANSKLLNSTSNIAGLLAFLLGGQVVWSVGLAMAVGQWIGGRIGSQLVLNKGAGLVRPVMVVMSLAITAKLVAADPENWIHQTIAAAWHRLSE